MSVFTRRLLNSTTERGVLFSVSSRFSTLLSPHVVGRPFSSSINSSWTRIVSFDVKKSVFAIPFVRFATLVNQKSTEAKKGELTPTKTKELKQMVWKNGTVRPGLITTKVGMSALWDSKGIRYPVTILKVDNVNVIEVKTKQQHGHDAVVLGYGTRKRHRVDPRILRICDELKVTPKQKLKEFKVTKNCLLPPGFELRAEHFVPGQYVDVHGITMGKGFQGPMKRWGFGGLPASHGVSLVHRSHGSTGCRQTPGRVFKGKKMAGRMGNAKKVIRNLKVMKVDTGLNLIFVRGHVPGHDNNYIYVKDAIFVDNKIKLEAKIPVPTLLPGVELPRELLAPEFDPLPPMEPKKEIFSKGGKTAKTAKAK